MKSSQMSLDEIQIKFKSITRFSFSINDRLVVITI